jgi:hypothetical protein
VGDPLPLVRSLLSIPGLALRRDWLYAQVQERDSSELGRELAQLCEDAERLDPASREALVPLVTLIAWRGHEPWVEQLRDDAAEWNRNCLARLLRVYPLPTYYDDETTHSPVAKDGCELTLGERKSLARKPQRRTFERLLVDPHPQVIRQLLGNPHLTETDVIALLSVRPGRPSTIETLAEFPEWLVRLRIRKAIINCPASPSHVTVPLVALATRPELQDIADSPTLNVVLRGTAREYLERRPPLSFVETNTIH